MTARARGVAVLTFAHLVLSASAVLAAAEPILRARIEPDDVVVGREQRLVVEVLVLTWLLGAPRLPELEIPGVIVVESGEAGVSLTESIDGATWSGVSNEYALYAQRPGTYTTPRARVSVRYARDGAPVEVEVSLPPVRFAARLPPGGVGGPLLAASSVELTQTVEPTPENLRVGDALRRTVVLRAEKTRSMLLPELDTARVDGLTPYRDTPKLIDRRGRRGRSSLAERVESTSWILERPGTYELPAIEVAWWSVDEARMETAEVPAVAFSVAVNPALVAGAAPSSEPSRVGWLVAVAAVAVALVGAWGRVDLRSMRRRLVAALERARHSEPARFGAFVRATREGDAGKILTALFEWLDRRSPADETATIADFVEESSSPELGAQADALEASLFSRGEGTAWSPGELRRETVAARRRARGAKERRSSDPLAPLNP